MKKALIGIKKINSDDVISTSTLCSVDLTANDLLFQSDGNFRKDASTDSTPRFYLKTGSYYQYNSGSWSKTDGSYFDAYCDNYIIVEDGKWYHLSSDNDNGDDTTLIECTDPNHHNCSSN